MDSGDGKAFAMPRTEISGASNRGFDIISNGATNELCNLKGLNTVEPIVTDKNWVSHEKDKSCKDELIFVTGKLKSISTEISHYKFLRSLNLSRNALEQVPNEIGNLKNLVSLDLSHNLLRNLPNSLSDINNLRFLNISHNDFVAVPSVVCESLQFLMVFNISSNKVEYFDEHPYCLPNLVDLNLSHNKLKSIPKWIFTVHCKIESLDVNHNLLNGMDENYFSKNFFLKSITTLKMLDIQNCQLTMKHLQIFSKMTGLETLIVSNYNVLNSKNRNYFECLENLEKCEKLWNLNASNVGISFLSLNFDCLKYIQYLDLERNFLTWLPDSFCNLYSLKVCKLGSNSLFFLPTEFGKLINLQEIYLNNNHIAEVPDTFKNLVNLKYCDLYDNKLEYIDPELISMHKLRGIDLECNYLDFCTLFGNQEMYKDFISKYSTLKGHFRNQLDEMRRDFQNETKAEVILPQNEQFNINSEEEFDFTVDSSVHEELYNCAESWDEEKPVISLSYNEEDDFDPNVDYLTSLKLKKKIQKKSFSGNFCPGDSHVPSLMKHFKRKPYEAVKGQFDLN